jgi:glycosyltransferase A (GT-A) superfamily protein (DUF2064 family)
MKKKTAVLIFANSAKKEAERKSFLSAEIFSALNIQTLKTVEKSGIKYFHISEEKQVGNSFGARFSNAIETIFQKGFENVITIGNDTPHLKTRHLIDTLQQLEKNDSVLGPSKDGGFYLMGLKKSYFNKETFERLPWQTNRLHQKFSSLAHLKNLKIQYLEPLNDIDCKEDLKLIIHSFKAVSSSILKLLQKLFYRIKNNFFTTYFDLLKISFSQNFNKGSPFISAYPSSKY